MCLFIHIQFLCRHFQATLDCYNCTQLQNITNHQNYFANESLVQYNDNGEPAEQRFSAPTYSENPLSYPSSIILKLLQNYIFIPGTFNVKRKSTAVFNFTNIYESYNETDLDYNNSVIDHLEYDSF